MMNWVLLTHAHEVSNQIDASEAIIQLLLHSGSSAVMGDRLCLMVLNVECMRILVIAGFARGSFTCCVAGVKACACACACVWRVETEIRYFISL